MTNDRSNEDRVGDGRSPEWGEAPQQHHGEQPRYGEQADTASTQYGEQPRYGEQQHDGEQQYGQQQYGEQQTGQHQYGQQGQAPAWDRADHDRRDDHQQYAAAAPAGNAPSWQQYHEAPKRKKKTVGVVAFVLGLASLVLGIVGGWLMGAAFSGDMLNQMSQGGGTSVEQQQQLQQELMNDPAAMSRFGGGVIVAGIAAVLGLWALVQGIIAAVVNRGRGWGIVAIILAVVATIATLVAIGAAAAAGAAGTN